MGDHIFISYSSKNKVIADAVCHKLEERKMKCWMAPRDITPGANYAEELIKAIDNSTLFVLIFSEDSNKSPHVLRECERAVSRGIPIVPFRISDILPGEALQYFIGPQHWLDAITAPCAAHIDRLADTVHILLTQEDLTKKSAGEALADAEALAVQRQHQVVRMRRGMTVLAAVVVVFAVVGGAWFYTQQMNQASMTLVPFTDKAAGFQMQVPQGWTKSQPSPVAGQPPIAVIVYLPTNNQSENVFVNNVSANGASFDNVTSTNLNTAQNLVNTNQITMQESGLTTWAGQNAYKLVYTINSSGLQCMQIWTVSNNTVYQLTYNASPQHYTQYLSTVQSMVNSFQVI